MTRGTPPGESRSGFWSATVVSKNIALGNIGPRKERNGGANRTGLYAQHQAQSHGNDSEKKLHLGWRKSFARGEVNIPVQGAVYLGMM